MDPGGLCSGDGAHRLGFPQTLPAGREILLPRNSWTQRDWQHLGTTAVQVRSLARLSGLRIQPQWRLAWLRPLARELHVLRGGERKKRKKRQEKKEKKILQFFFQEILVRVTAVAQWVKNPTRMHEDSGGFCFVFLGVHPQHMEVPRPGV